MEIKDIVTQWDSVDARIRDAAVAEHVMGWKTYRTSNAGVVRMTPEAAADWGTGDSVECCLDGTETAVTDVGHLNAYVPDYTTDASEDYAVLCEVRAKWDAAQQKKFRHAFSLIAEGRLTPWRTLGSSIFMHYRVGDYSLAALKVVAALTALSAQNKE